MRIRVVYFRSFIYTRKVYSVRVSESFTHVATLVALYERKARK